VIAAWYGSRGLAYLSTAYYVSWLNFWVRNETRGFIGVFIKVKKIKKIGVENGNK